MIDLVISPVTGFSHVQLLVSDVRASERWYTTVLGLEPYAADDTLRFVALRHEPSGIVIVLSSRDGSRRDESVLDHLAFAVRDGDALSEWAGHLADAGVVHDGIVLERGRPSLQLRDPDGNAIELVAPRR
jgi:glyoxylase I family protein